MHKTALGKTIDMTALRVKNEKVRAVSNLKVNARGDKIDSHGRVVTPATERVNKGYSKTVGNRSANVTKKQVEQPKIKPKIQEELTDIEKELQETLEQEDLEIDRIKARKNG
jgi:hypothetical protein